MRNTQANQENNAPGHATVPRKAAKAISNMIATLWKVELLDYVHCGPVHQANHLFLDLIELNNWFWGLDATPPRYATEPDEDDSLEKSPPPELLEETEPELLEIARDEAEANDSF